MQFWPVSYPVHIVPEAPTNKAWFFGSHHPIINGQLLLHPMHARGCTHTVKVHSALHGGHSCRPPLREVGKETLREVSCLRSPQEVAQSLSHSDPVLFTCPRRMARVEALISPKKITPLSLTPSLVQGVLAILHGHKPKPSPNQGSSGALQMSPLCPLFPVGRWSRRWQVRRSPSLWPTLLWRQLL